MTRTTLALLSPGGATYSAIGASGTIYNTDVSGVIQVPYTSGDIGGLIDAGWTPTPVNRGVQTRALALIGFKNADGTTLAAAAASGKFGIGITLGTSEALNSEAANNNTKTDDAITEIVMPDTYIAATDFSVVVNAKISGAGTLTTKTLAVKAYRTANDGTQGANIGPAAQVITAGGADLTFVITGATLSPGDRVVLELETVLVETAASATTAVINSVRLAA